MANSLNGRYSLFYDKIIELRSSFNLRYAVFFIYTFFSLLLFFPRRKADSFCFYIWMLLLLFALGCARNIYFFIPAGIIVLAQRYNYIKEFFSRNVFRLGIAVFFKILLILFAIAASFNLSKDIAAIPGRTVYYFSGDNKLKKESLFMGMSEAAYPKGMIEFIKNTKLPERMFNNFNIGALLIFNFFPQRQVFIDGRTELYGPDFFSFYVDIIDGREINKAVEKYNLDGFIIGCTKDLPAPLIKALYEQGFKCIYFGGDGIIFLTTKALERNTHLKKSIVDFTSLEIPKIDMMGSVKLRLPVIKSLYNQAEILYILGFYDKAVPLLEQITDIYPNSFKAYHLLAAISYHRKDYPEAFSYCRRSLFYNKDFKEAKELLIKIWISTGNLKEAYKAAHQLGVNVKKIEKYACE